MLEAAPAGRQDLPDFCTPKPGSEYALARSRTQERQGYGGFTFHTSPDVTLEQDLSRPDRQQAMQDAGLPPVIDPLRRPGEIRAACLRQRIATFGRRTRCAYCGWRVTRPLSPMRLSVAPEKPMALMRELAEVWESTGVDRRNASWKEISRRLDGNPNPKFSFVLLHDCWRAGGAFADGERLLGVAATQGAPSGSGHRRASAVFSSRPRGWDLPLPGAGLPVCMIWARATDQATLGPSTMAIGKTRAWPPFKAVTNAQAPGTARSCTADLRVSHPLPRALELNLQPLINAVQEASTSIAAGALLSQFLGACRADAEGYRAGKVKPYPQAEYCAAAAERRAASAFESVVGSGPSRAQHMGGRLSLRDQRGSGLQAELFSAGLIATLARSRPGGALPTRLGL